MELIDTTALEEKLATLSPPPGREIWMQEGVDDPDTEANERKQFRNGDYDSLLVAWAKATGSTGVSDHEPVDKIKRIASVVPGELVMTCYPQRGIYTWNEWTDCHDNRVSDYRNNMKDKFAPCSRVFINAERAKNIWGDPRCDAIVSRFLLEIAGAIREHSPGCAISNYNEGMYLAEHQPWRNLPRHTKIGDFDCLSGYPDDVGIQKDIIEASQMHSRHRPYQLCIWPHAAQHRANYHVKSAPWRFYKKIVAWHDNEAACRHYRQIGMLVGSRELCHSVLVHRPDLLDMNHVNIMAALYEGIAA